MADTTTVTPPPKRNSRRHMVTWTVVGILAGAAVLGGLTGAARANHAGPLPTNRPSPSPAAVPATVVGTWRIIRVPGVQTGVHVPGEYIVGTRPVPSVVAKTVPGPVVTTTVHVPVPGPKVIVSCTVTAVPPAGPSPNPSATPSLSAPTCTTATAAPTP